MNQAILFSNLMQYLWGDENPEPGFTIRAMGDRLKGTARCNHENAMDVLAIAFREEHSIANVRLSDSDLDQDAGEFDHEVIYTVQFPDTSTCLVILRRGIGSQVEVL